MRLIQVDAFTATPFRGNPAAVCILPAPAEEAWMKAIAREMNLSETAFLWTEEEPSTWGLRWFTPTTEVDLCGHATLASAHVLWTEGHLDDSTRAHFRTRSGRLEASRHGDWIDLEFPSEPPADADPPPGLLEALGVRPIQVARNRMDFLVEVENEDAVRAAQPDFALLRRVPVRGVILTSRATGKEYDFVSRFFAPAVGVDEDPVTGSAHCALAPYWGTRLGTAAMTGYQASARGGIVRVRLGGDRVLLSGQAVTVLRCEIEEAAAHAGAGLD